jgi:hypothetical protein
MLANEELDFVEPKGQNQKGLFSEGLPMYYLGWRRKKNAKGSNHLGNSEVACCSGC